MRRFFRLLVLYLFQVGFCLPILKWVAPTRYRRKHLVPEGPCLVVANHNSHLDAAVLLWLFPLRRIARVHPVAAADYFGRSWIMRTLAMACMNGIPIERRPAPGQDPLAPVSERLQRGESLIFFPEGTRGEAGVVAQFRPGIGRLVKSVPGMLVVPVFMAGPERIWPRGGLPVPLSIDVNVGPPRTYPTHLDAREIARRAREDVLALAPPPPPVPGPRPAPPLRVAVCGIDGEVRREVHRELAELLGRVERTMGIGDPPLEADERGVREVAAPLPLTRSRAWLGLLARTFRVTRRFKGQRFAAMVERAAVDEALELGSAARFVVGGGEALVDLLATAEADFYRGAFDEDGLVELMHYLTRERTIPLRRWWFYGRKTPEVWLLNTFDLARPMAPDVLVLLRTPPERAMERLRQQGRELQPFQNEGFLERLEQGYGNVARGLRRRRRTEVLEFDTETADSATIGREVERVCRRLIERKASGSA
jgi:1-acyl-sn-glycerol-3-phosphate acyltransferase